MFAWLQGPGRGLRHPLKGSTNYLGAYNARGELVRTKGDAQGKRTSLAKPVRDDLDEEDELEAIREREKADNTEKSGGKKGNELPPERPQDLRPFPLNTYFKSQPILSEDLREEIWRRVQQDGSNIRIVSAELGVSIERVAAVVRMKEIEKRWVAEGKPLATPYSRAVLSMLPTTPFSPGRPPIVHEPINDLRVHPDTKHQVFVPVSESRHFTREDAGKAFSADLLSTEKRIPHPELVELEKDIVNGVEPRERIARARERMRQEEETRQKREEARKKRIEESVKVFNSGNRFMFRFEECNAEAVGKDGRSHKGVGWRYGVPHEDRKKGQVKIPKYVL
ncbi:hypothetical protein NA57DRAFT_70334 [Rhizodiscina lignyota]|uniref:Eukaryotic mitochondrial regulator protein-domain-containing protein n=1 Tax=Rhizodiscina lignyota TaxID=1504668 RepID=A0A9P4IQA6_9PEZI|nr:hypothetical protein NA57DRAFT_70334 [Rhizodiscina lignyota]